MTAQRRPDFGSFFDPARQDPIEVEQAPTASAVFPEIAVHGLQHDKPHARDNLASQLAAEGVAKEISRLHFHALEALFYSGSNGTNGWEVAQQRGRRDSAYRPRFSELADDYGCAVVLEGVVRPSPQWGEPVSVYVITDLGRDVYRVWKGLHPQKRGDQ